jgi:asparagine synthase (glutamine-hydrolysing)
MCGIAGFLEHGSAAADDLADRLTAMTSALAHRGPDAHGVWTDPEAGIGLGNRRLAIIDLSPAGAQPQHSADGRWVVTYNGELYNARELRQEIEADGHRGGWRGHSDTEVLIEAVARWGVPDAMQRLNGMFGMALWDRLNRQLWLVRDRIGIKPLYWTRTACGTFLFASELRAMRVHPAFVPRIDLRAVTAFLRWGAVPAPLTIYEGVHKLLPGHLLRVEVGAEPSMQQYWDLRAIAVAGQRKLDARPEAEAIEHLEQLLRDAVGRQMVSDVPLGAFLSGGIDSSTVVALMQAQSSRPVHTFSVRSHDWRYNEADDAGRVARHLRTDHTELVLEPGATRAAIERMAEIYDEPFADSSQVPTYLISEMARRHVTVALTGDGGDECFAGYNRHRWLTYIAASSRRVPEAIMKGAGGALALLSVELWDSLARALPSRSPPRFVGQRIHKAASVLGAGTLEEMYRRVVAQWPEPAEAIRCADEPPMVWDDATITADLPDPMAVLRYFDMTHYLPDDILAKVDRASMAVGLEVRVPLLDHRVIEHCWRLPRSMLVRRGTGKWILRRVLAHHVPPAIFERQKMGFAVPVGEWIKGPLAEWTQELLSEREIANTGILDAAAVRRRLADHLSGRRDCTTALWTALMLQACYRRWMQDPVPHATRWHGPSGEKRASVA